MDRKRKPSLVLGVPHPTSKPSLVSSTPHPTSKLPLVSSTPHPTRRHKLTFEFEKDDISPITTKADETGKAAKQTRVVKKRTKPIAEVVDKVVLRKKKCTVPQEKESASSAVLKEMGVKLQVKPTNILSTSRNMYNMFPQPVILDSDEETKDDIVKPSASSVRLKDVYKKRGLTKKPDPCITKDQKKIKIEKEASKEMTSTKETPQPSSSKSGAIKKKPLRKLTTDGSTLQAAKAKDKQTTTVQLISDSDDEDSMFPVNLSNARKTQNTHLKFSTLKNIIDDNSPIKWTPRSKSKNLKLIKEEDSESESVNCDTDDCTVLKTKNFSDTRNNHENKENCKDTNKNNVLTTNDRIQNETFPKELFSRFSDIVFHPSSKQNKGVALASSLVAGSSEFGYIELGEAKLLRGKLKNITLVMIEGKVKAVFKGKSGNLSPGDILHINEGSGYQLHNLGTGHARLLYVKEKHS